MVSSFVYHLPGLLRIASRVFILFFMSVLSPSPGAVPANRTVGLRFCWYRHLQLACVVLSFLFFARSTVSRLRFRLRRRRQIAAESAKSWLLALASILLTHQAWSFLYIPPTIANYYPPDVLIWLRLHRHPLSSASGWHLLLSSCTQAIAGLCSCYFSARISTGCIRFGLFHFGLHTAHIESVA